MNFHPRGDESVDINLTPLIDVVFLLLIFFMVTTTFQRHAELKIELPQADSAERETLPERIELVIDAGGRYYIDGRELVNTQPQTVLEALRSVAEGREDLPLIIRADATAPYQAVVTAMDAAGRLGISRLSIATTQSDAQ
jgi:biopolymer transport protein ExbD